MPVTLVTGSNAGIGFATALHFARHRHQVVAVIFEAVVTERPRLRYPVGVDAEGLAAGRARISDEEWVAMGGELRDEEYHARFKRYFGIDL